MALMKWTDAYSVGNEVLDNQHRELIGLVNKLDSDADLAEVLDGLRGYCETHFRTEEDLLTAAGYPGLAEHRKMHDAFRTWLGGLIAAHKSGGDAAVARRDIHHYLGVWLGNHLLVQDQAYAPWLPAGGPPARQ